MYIKNIDNPLHIDVTKTEVYSGIFEYRLPIGYYFESCGTSYGNSIWGRAVLDNYYVVKKRENETDTSKDSK